ncbi:MAG TPA: hypothetical protein VED01_18295 [Burkholderiales bacterium]|nr:hypothetical protein [Burkholderiales bacterium]
MEIVTGLAETLRRALHKAGPYLIVEIVLPGGTLFALALAVYRYRKLISVDAVEERFRAPRDRHGAVGASQ